MVGNWRGTIGNLRGNGSAGEEEEHCLADACSFVALRVDPLDDDALGFRDSLSLFCVTGHVSTKAKGMVRLYGCYRANHDAEACN